MCSCLRSHLTSLLEQKIFSLLLCLITVPQFEKGPVRDCRALTLFAGVAQDLIDLSICGVLPQRPDDVTDLAQGDLGITSPVKEEEGLLEVCKGRTVVKSSQTALQ